MPAAADQPYPQLFSPFELAGRRLRNRIVHASISLRYAVDQGVSQRLIDFHANRAKGGAAMIITEPVGVAPHQPARRVIAWDDSRHDDLARWAAAVEVHDCRLLAQVQDIGRGRHVPGRSFAAIAPSPLPDDLSLSVPRAWTTDEIEAFVESTVGACLRLQRAGFSGVEVSAGHGHLFHQFLSLRSNHREDRYGGDLAGRARLLVDLCGAIRSACGATFILGVKLPGDDGVEVSAGHGHLFHQFLSLRSNHREDRYGGDLAGRARLLVDLCGAIRSACGTAFILGVKLPGDDGVEGGIGPVHAAEIARHLVGRVTVDFLSYAQGSHHRTLEMHIPDGASPRVTYRELNRQLRSATPDVPVMALGRITDPAEAESLLAAGEAELIGLGRALITDPEWPRKAAAGRAHDIRYCVSCNTCWRTIVADLPLACDNNPRAGHADEVGWQPAPATLRRKVVVVGAGIAGLEAAVTAAARGHVVTVIGASAGVGGKTRLHASLPVAEALSSIYDYQLVAAQRLGVQFDLGLHATAAHVIALDPDVVVLATGSTMLWPECLDPQLGRDGIVTDLRAAIAGLAAHRASIPGAAVILDLDQTEGTYAAAERLRDLFDRVIIVTPRDRIAEDTALVTRQRVLRRCHQRGIEVRTLVEPRITAAFENEARVDCVSVYGGAAAPIENVALFTYATPRVPDDALVAPLASAGIDVHRIGDCKVARGVLDATAEGYAIGMKV